MGQKAGGGGATGGGGGAKTGGQVSVHAYERSDGTDVKAYTRGGPAGTMHAPCESE
jgi:hypothetical protein